MNIKSKDLCLLIILLIMIVISGCSESGTTGPDNENQSDLTGDYMGQQQPGITPVRFTPESLLPDGTWWWISAPKFSPDHADMIFTKYIRSDTDTKHLFLAHRYENDFWSVPQEVSFGSPSGVDCHAAFSIDGTKLFFLSHRAEGNFFYVTKDVSGNWTNPVSIYIPSSSGAGNQFSITRDESIYFEMSNGQADDIYRTRLINNQYSVPENLGTVINMDEYEDYAPFIDPDEEYLIFASNRPGGFGGNDLYISFTDNSGNWTPPQNMGSNINTAGGDTIPYVSFDGNYFFFISMRGNDQGYNPYWMDADIIDTFR